MPRISHRRLQLIHDIELLLLQSPNATLEQLANKSGVGPITLYRYFDTREGLVRAIAEFIFDDLDSMKEDVYKARGNFESLMSNLIMHLIPRLTHIQFLFNLNAFIDAVAKLPDVYQRTLDIRKEFGTYVVKLVEKGKKEKVINKERDTLWLAHAMSSVLFAAKDFMPVTRNQLKMQAYLETVIIEQLTK